MGNVNYFLAVGSHENWKSAFGKGNIWGVGENRFRAWDQVQPGDILFFYVEIPVSAVVGYGTILSEFYDAKPFFAEDWRSDSDWPWRFRFQIQWPSANVLSSRRINVEDLRFTLHRGFQGIAWRKAQELLRLCSFV